MGSTTEPIVQQAVHDDGSLFDATQKATILRELDAILNSPFFLTSKRCKQFLSYVVRHRLEGNHERLKERTIGVELFQRPVGYATGDDPVVRVQAGEVRRRLEQYYHAASGDLAVRIELHVGSYAAEFKWAQPPPSEQGATQTQIELHQQDTPESTSAARESPQVPAPAGMETKHNPRIRTHRIHSLLTWVLPLAGLVLIAALVLLGLNLYHARTPKSVLEEFWSPALTSTEPVLICLAKPSVYMPSTKLYQRHSKTPSKFNSLLERLTQSPDLQPNDKLVWSDMVEYRDYGLATGDVYAATRLSALFGQIGKSNQVRIGDSYSFEDLRNFPAIVIGAFNNRWTMQMTSNLHFGFTEEEGQSIIREQGPSGRQWSSKSGADRAEIEDFGIVTRLLNSKTGQFVVAVAGIKSYGTQAAGELVSSPEYLEKALRTAPPDWKRRNLQIVVETTVTDSTSGPPQVVAIYVW
jgi:hypothetical protein